MTCEQNIDRLATIVGKNFSAILDCCKFEGELCPECYKRFNLAAWAAKRMAICKFDPEMKFDDVPTPTFEAEPDRFQISFDGTEWTITFGEDNIG